jgi:homopolymeric O-antigen transport system permease protein
VNTGEMADTVVRHGQTLQVGPEAASSASHLVSTATVDAGALCRAIAVIRPGGEWEVIDFRELWWYRHVFSVFLWRNVIRRYRQTLLGPFWFILGPVVRMCIFTFALGRIAGLPSEGIPYPLFTFAALLPWELFSSGVLRSSESLVSYEHIISKVYFPRLFVPATEVIGGLVDFALSFIVLLMMMLAYGFPLTSRLVIIPFLLGITLALSLAIGLLFAAMQARYRDTTLLLGYVIQLWFIATPVAYSAAVLTNHVPHALLRLYRWNPMNGVVEAFRWALLGTGHPPDASLAVSAVVTLALLLVGAAVFARTEHSIIDLI